ncbi:P-loop containing nucleoside triphosphate hydrolase protein [Jimgerdemannia flammicorona]|uniref:DNA 3'-5' helicase n=1 Tax=Jimgerdemannia flammicorona TaxID=994334 RepID=A0A433D3B5_9FUNG|nr:P-loop containing nucleoside triphosphate hydrolase protein [Jimgerdemannia flammicorona]
MPTTLDFLNTPFRFWPAQAPGKPEVCKLRTDPHVSNPSLFQLLILHQHHTVLTSRVAWLVDSQGVDPSRIIVATFTNKAANEMQERLDSPRLLGERSRKVIMGTFHSTCSSFLRRHADKIGLDRNFTIVDTGIRYESLGFEIFLSEISKAKSHNVGCDAFARTHAKDKADVAVVYTWVVWSWSLDAAVRDFDDLLVSAHWLLSAHPEILAFVEHVLVDEFQDTNPIQYDLLKLFAAARRRITVVGGESPHLLPFVPLHPTKPLIITWPFPSPTHQIRTRASSVGAMPTLATSPARFATSQARSWRGWNATTAVWEPSCGALCTSWPEVPSPRPAGGAETSTARARDRDAGGRGSTDEIEYCVKGIGGGAGFMLISLSHKVGGHKFFDRVEIKDLLSYLRLACNPSDSLALARTINIPRRGVGNATMDAVLEIAKRRRCTTWRVVKELAKGVSEGVKVKAGVRGRVRGFVGVVEEFSLWGWGSGSVEDILIAIVRFDGVSLRYTFHSITHQIPLGIVIERLVDRIRYEAHLKDSYPDWESRIENVQELANYASRFAEEEEEADGSIASDPLTRFLEATSLSTDKEEGRGDMNAEVRVGELSFFSIIDVVTSTTDRHSDRSFGGRDAELYVEIVSSNILTRPCPSLLTPCQTFQKVTLTTLHTSKGTTGMAVCVHHRVRGWADPTRAEQGFNRGDERGEPAAVRRNDEGEIRSKSNPLPRFSLLSQCPMPAPERYILPLNDPDSQSACQIQDKQLSPFLRDLPADAHADHRPVVDAQVRAQVAEVLGRPVPDESVALEEEEDEIVVVDGVGPEKDRYGRDVGSVEVLPFWTRDMLLFLTPPQSMSCPRRSKPISYSTWTAAALTAQFGGFASARIAPAEVDPKRSTISKMASHPVITTMSSSGFTSATKLLSAGEEYMIGMAVAVGTAVGTKRKIGLEEDAQRAGVGQRGEERQKRDNLSGRRKNEEDVGIGREDERTETTLRPTKKRAQEKERGTKAGKAAGIMDIRDFFGATTGSKPPSSSSSSMSQTNALVKPDQRFQRATSAPVPPLTAPTNRIIAGGLSRKENNPLLPRVSNSLKLKPMREMVAEALRVVPNRGGRPPHVTLCLHAPPKQNVSQFPLPQLPPPSPILPSKPLPPLDPSLFPHLFFLHLILPPRQPCLHPDKERAASEFGRQLGYRPRLWVRQPQRAHLFDLCVRQLLREFKPSSHRHRMINQMASGALRIELDTTDPTMFRPLPSVPNDFPPEKNPPPDKTPAADNQATTASKKLEDEHPAPQKPPGPDYVTLPIKPEPPDNCCMRFVFREGRLDPFPPLRVRGIDG